STHPADPHSFPTRRSSDLPSHYKCAALPTELSRQDTRFYPIFRALSNYTRSAADIPARECVVSKVSGTGKSFSRACQVSAALMKRSTMADISSGVVWLMAMACQRMKSFCSLSMARVAPPVSWPNRLDSSKRRKTVSRSVTGIVPSELRSEEHTSELQSRENLVCRLLLEKKK